MNIADASMEDVRQFAKIGALFHVEGRLPGRFIEKRFVENWDKMLASGNALFIVSKEAADEVTGAIAGLMFTDPNSEDLIAQECFWYVHPDKRGAGVALLAAFEKKARLYGCARIIMTHLTSIYPDSLRELYRRRGYREVEVNYTKEI